MEKENKKKHKVLKCILTTVIILIIFASIGVTAFITYKKTRVLTANDIEVSFEELVETDGMWYGVGIYNLQNTDEYFVSVNISKIKKYKTIEFDIDVKDGVKILALDNKIDYKGAITVDKKHVKIDVQKCLSLNEESVDYCYFVYKVKIIDINKRDFVLTNIKLTDLKNNKYAHENIEFHPNYGGNELFRDSNGWLKMGNDDNGNYEPTGVYFDKGYYLVRYQCQRNLIALMYHDGKYELFDISNKEKNGKPILLRTFEPNNKLFDPLDAIWIHDYSNDGHDYFVTDEINNYNIYDLNDGRIISYENKGVIHDNNGANIYVDRYLKLNVNEYLGGMKNYEGPCGEDDEGYTLDLTTGYYYSRKTGHEYRLFDEKKGYADIDTSKYEVREEATDVETGIHTLYVLNKDTHDIYSISSNSKLKNKEIIMNGFSILYKFTGLTSEDFLSPENYKTNENNLGNLSEYIDFCSVDEEAENIFASYKRVSTVTDYVIIQSDYLKHDLYLFKRVPSTNVYELYKVTEEA